MDVHISHNLTECACRSRREEGGGIIIIKAVVDVHIKCERLVHAAATTDAAM